MKKCKVCGFNNEDAFAFCTECGNKLTEDITSNDGYDEEHQQYQDYQPQYSDYSNSSGSKKSRKLIFIVIGAIVVVGLALVAALMAFGVIGPKANAGNVQYGEETREESAMTPAEYAESIKISEYDINFSQAAGNFAGSGVDVLMRIKNNNDEAIKGITFTVAGSDGHMIENIKNGKKTFHGYGYVAPYESGYIYAKMYVSNDTPTGQGQITVTKAYRSDIMDQSQVTTGEVTEFHKSSDTYDVKVNNPTDEAVTADDAVVIAVKRGYTKLADSWGAGKLTEEIPAGDTKTLKSVIYNPGFVNFEDNTYKVFIIDKTKL